MRWIAVRRFPVALALMSSLAGAPLGSPDRPATEAGDGVDIRIGRATLDKLLKASVPYEVKVKTGLFDQIVTLTDPRDIELRPGVVRLKMNASGHPIPFQAVVTPEIRIREDREIGRFTVSVEKLPLEMGRAGKWDIASFIKPVPIERVSRHLIDTPGREIGLNLIVSAIEIDTTGVSLRFETEFD